MDRQSNDILKLLAANVNHHSLRFISELKKSITKWNLSSKEEIKQATISSKSIKSTEESNSQPESSPPSPLSQKSSLSAPKNMDREPSISSDNTLTPPHPPHPDGSQELLPTRSPRSIKNLDSSSLPTPRATTRQSSKPHTSTSQPSHFATLTLPSSSLMSSSLATTEFPSQSPLSSGCLPVKFVSLEVNSSRTKNGTFWSTCSSQEIWKPSDKLRRRLDKKKRRQINRKEQRTKLQKDNNRMQQKYRNKTGDCSYL